MVGKDEVRLPALCRHGVGVKLGSLPNYSPLIPCPG
jgi:hypothetical protein